MLLVWQGIRPIRSPLKQDHKVQFGIQPNMVYGNSAKWLLKQVSNILKKYCLFNFIEAGKQL